MVETPWSIRQDDWKLVCPRKHRPLESIEADQFELYNLTDDPSETRDVARAHLEVDARLFEQFQAQQGAETAFPYCWIMRSIHQVG